MSDLKITDGDDTVEFQLDAAMARSAALREELGAAQLNLSIELARKPMPFAPYAFGVIGGDKGKKVYK